MVVDQTTLNDLSLFHTQEEYSLFHQLNFTQSQVGKDYLHHLFSHPLSDLQSILDTHAIIGCLHRRSADWPVAITNGTIMMMEKFFDSQLDTMPVPANAVNATAYRLFHSSDFSLTRFSLTHFSDFLKGMKTLQTLFEYEPPEGLRRANALLERMRMLMDHAVVRKLVHRRSTKPFRWTEVIFYGKFFKERFRNAVSELIGIFGQFDAWRSMAVAMEKYQLTFPVFHQEEHPRVRAKQLYHLLLAHPVPYDIEMNKDSNFIFLTGANMAGKSTFIKAVGCAVYLAHMGMGVPAREMQLSVFDGMLSNINVMDNIAKGESYFFNEVQRIRNTIVKINDKRKWLVLIDELFKGTNVQDAMKCSSVVIQGLIKIRNSLFILSTHLYEIGQELEKYPNISFRFFETTVQNEQLSFSYQLKEGISNDRLGYLILKREKVVDLLESL